MRDTGGASRSCLDQPVGSKGPSEGGGAPAEPQKMSSSRKGGKAGRRSRDRGLGSCEDSGEPPRTGGGWGQGGGPQYKESVHGHSEVHRQQWVPPSIGWGQWLVWGEVDREGQETASLSLLGEPGSHSPPTSTPSRPPSHVERLPDGAEPPPQSLQSLSPQPLGSGWWPYDSGGSLRPLSP